MDPLPHVAKAVEGKGRRVGRRRARRVVQVQLVGTVALVDAALALRRRRAIRIVNGPSGGEDLSVYESELGAGGSRGDRQGAEARHVAPQVEHEGAAKAGASANDMQTTTRGVGGAPTSRCRRAAGCT